jgi:multicomponent Na+:H+ antiporter subunit F
LAIVVGVIVLLAAVSGSGITMVIAVVVSLLGFIGSAGLAKLLPRDRH